VSPSIPFKYSVDSIKEMRRSAPRISYMMWIIDGYDTCNSRHGRNNTVETEQLQKIIWGVSLLINTVQILGGWYQSHLFVSNA